MHTLRTLLGTATLMVLLGGGSRALAQDPAADAAAQAQQAAMQAFQAAQQAAQQQMDQMQRDNAARSQAEFQRNMEESANNAKNGLPYCCIGTAQPTFSMKAGTYSKTLQVKIRDNTRGAVIYYTTDGWTPTTASARYRGPVTIDATTQLQAIAVGPAPFFARSLVAKAQYRLTVSPAATGTGVPSQSALGSKLSDKTVAGQYSGRPAAIPAGSAMLRQGTPVHLVFVADVSSRKADVGDKIELRLAEDIRDGDVVLVTRGAPAEATITEADKTGPGGAPGNIAFEVESMNANGTTVQLRGSATREGDPKLPGAATLIPVVGAFTLFRHGKDAEIKVGTPMTAFVAADTTLATSPW